MARHDHFDNVAAMARPATKVPGTQIHQMAGNPSKSTDFIALWLQNVHLAVFLLWTPPHRVQNSVSLQLCAQPHPAQPQFRR